MKYFDRAAVALDIFRLLLSGKQMTAHDIKEALAVIGVNKDIRTIQRNIRLLMSHFDEVECDRSARPHTFRLDKFGYKPDEWTPNQSKEKENTMPANNVTTKYLIETNDKNIVTSLANSRVEHSRIDLTRLDKLVQIFVNEDNKFITVSIPDLDFERQRSNRRGFHMSEVTGIIHQLLNSAIKTIWSKSGVEGNLKLSAEQVFDLIFLTAGIHAIRENGAVSTATGADFLEGIFPMDDDRPSPAIFTISPLTGKGMVIKLDELAGGLITTCTIDGREPMVFKYALPEGLAFDDIRLEVETTLNNFKEVRLLSRVGGDKIRSLSLAKEFDASSVNEILQETIGALTDGGAGLDGESEFDPGESPVQENWLEYSFPIFSIKGPVQSAQDIADVYIVTTQDNESRQVWFEKDTFDEMSRVLSVASEASALVMNNLRLTQVCTRFSSVLLPILTLDMNMHVLSFMDFYSKQLQDVNEDGACLSADILLHENKVLVSITANPYHTTETFDSTSNGGIKSIPTFLRTVCTRLRHNPNMVMGATHLGMGWDGNQNSASPLRQIRDTWRNWGNRRMEPARHDHQPVQREQVETEEPNCDAVEINRSSFPYQIVEDAKLKDHSTGRVFEVTMGELGFGFYVMGSFNVKGGVFFIPTDSVVQHFKPMAIR